MSSTLNESRLIYITGGARSGKSSHAETLAARSGKAVSYLATAQAFDKEMLARIGRHRSERPTEWMTLEEPLRLAECAAQVSTPVLLLDCLSLWVSNMLLQDWDDDQMLDAAQKLLDTLRARGGLNILVSNEVGLGIVPDNALARRYRDILGWVNQRAAQASQEAYFLVSGQVLKLK